LRPKNRKAAAEVTASDHIAILARALWAGRKINETEGKLIMKDARPKKSQKTHGGERT